MSVKKKQNGCFEGKTETVISLSYVNISITAILCLKYMCYAQELVINQAG